MEPATPFTDIIIADTQLLIIEGLKAVLAGKYNITDVAGSKNELLNLLQKKTPKIVLIDYCLMDFDSFEDLAVIKRNYPEAGIIILSNTITYHDLTEYNRAGIKHILHKSADTGEINQCLEALLKGRKFYSEYVLDLMFEQNNKKGSTLETSQLTASETEILRLISDGLTNKEIASKKCLSIHTIMTHRKNILRKLGVSNASELIMVAIKRGLIGNIDYQI
jgi:DNA-binding NarL/FixJ family response regulator